MESVRAGADRHASSRCTRGACAASRAPRVFDTEVVHKDGRRIPVEIATTPVTLDGRNANVTFLIDVSHRQQRRGSAARAPKRAFVR